MFSPFSIFEQLALALKNIVFPGIFHCIDYILFINQEFWATCAYPEKQIWPEILHCIEIFFIILDFWATYVCPESFHCFEIFFIIQEFWATCACPENRICPEIFQVGRRQPPRLVRLWAYGIEHGWANFLRGGPHFLKMLQPRAAHSHYKVGKFIQCENNHIFILQTIFIFHTRYV